MKKIFLLIVFAFVFLSTTVLVFASGFQLKTIGGLNTIGKLYDHWWYSNGQPTFAGEGVSASEVVATIDGTVQNITVDENSLWSFTPAQSLANGDHQISFSSNESVISFTLTIGGDIPADTSASIEASAPVVGNTKPLQKLVTIAGILLALFFIFSFPQLKSALVRK